jgi:hypothetical protein
MLWLQFKYIAFLFYLSLGTREALAALLVKSGACFCDERRHGQSSAGIWQIKSPVYQSINHG